MKKIVLILVQFLIFFSTKGQISENSGLYPGLKGLEDRIAIRELVDNFAILADKKDALTQAELFTETAIVEIIQNGQLTMKLNGRKEIADTFGRVLAGNESLYHFNGQNIVSINGDKASGIVYCMTYLTNTENGKKIKTTMAIHYNDEYIRENGRWLFARRTSVFDWTEREESDQ